MQDPTAMAAFQAAAKPPQFPEQEQHLRCPRCDSTNTKFCYYNNYNLSQPRHFCKNCRRYWTKGGALRNIPIGGGTRKNSSKRTSNNSSPSTNPKRPNITGGDGGGGGGGGGDDDAGDGSTVPPPPLPFRFPKIETIYPLPADADCQMLNITGSFSSLLASTEQFGSLLDSFHPGDPGAVGLPPPDGSNDLNIPIGSNGSEKPPVPVPENFLTLQGDSSCWNGGGGGGWPDLAIYTPGSSFE